jgi:hypothetical protein
LELSFRFELNKGDNGKQVGEYLYRQLERFIKVGQDDIKSLGYLALLKKMAEEAVIRLLNTDYTLGQLQAFSRLKEDDFIESTNYLLSPTYPMELEGQSVLRSEIQLFSYFLKECYADVIMLYTLNLSFAQYLRILLYSSEFNYESAGKHIHAQVQQRIHLVRTTLCAKEFWNDTTCSETLKTFQVEVNESKDTPKLAKKIWQTCLGVLQKRGDPTWFPPPILELVIHYLNSCMSTAMMTCQNHFELGKMRQDLYSQFETVVLQDRLMGDEFREFIYQSRKEMLERLL